MKESPTRDVVLMFSGGKDSVAAGMALDRGRSIEQVGPDSNSDRGARFCGNDDPADLQVASLLCTYNEVNHRVALHGTPVELVRRQARSLGLPLLEVPLPDDCDNSTYCARVGRALEPLIAGGLQHVACGDLFLDDVRRFRESQFAELGLAPVFPIWGMDTRALAETLIGQGLEALICCVDEQVLDRSLLGRTWDRGLIDELPEGVDPCGENGEFHTFVTRAPLMREPVGVRSGALHVSHGRFCMIDLQPA